MALGLATDVDRRDRAVRHGKVFCHTSAVHTRSIAINKCEVLDLGSEFYW